MDKQAGVFDTILSEVKKFFGSPVDEYKDSADTEIEDRVEDVEQGKDVPPNFLEDQEDELPVIEPQLEVGEVKVYTYKLNIPDELYARLGDVNVDHSFAVLRYLQSLGYVVMDFIINPDPSHKEDVCDRVADKNPWDLIGVLAAAKDDAANQGYPVAPIFWMTHPGCKGYLHVYPPSDIDQIPNDAPGLHMWEDEDKIIEEKTELMLQLPPVNVDRYTLAPMMFGEMSIPAEMSMGEEIPEEMREKMRPYYEGIEPEETASANLDRVKSAGPEWSFDVKPVRVKQTIFVKQPLGLIQVVLGDFIGLQSETFNKLTKVYLPDLERELVLPIDVVEILEVAVADTNDAEPGDFVLVDEDTIGLLLQQIGNEVIVYAPEFDGLLKTDEWTTLMLGRS